MDLRLAELLKKLVAPGYLDPSDSEKQELVDAVWSMEDWMQGIKKQKFAYLIRTDDGHWGRGDTPQEAAKVANKAGASGKSTAVLNLILNDTTPEVNERGTVIRDPGSENISICKTALASILRWE